MNFSGTVTIKAARQTVWEFITDVHKVSSCAPGVESVEVITPNQKFRATASVGFGSVKAKFNGTGEFIELDAPNRAKIKGHGDAPGSAVDVISEMRLSDGPGATTELNWTAEVIIVGMLASLAARMMGGMVKLLTGEFFNCVQKKIEG